MKKEFTKEFMINNKGCYSHEDLSNCSFMSNDIITLNSILTSEIPLKDKFWFVCKKLATNEENQLIAIGVAEIVLEIFENKYPKDDRPRKAIQAAKDYLKGIISINELNLPKRNAYAATYANADDYDYAAYAAAYAAYAATYADAAAVYVDDAYAYADNAATYADAIAYADNAANTDVTYKNSLLRFLINFCQNIES